MGVDMDMAMDMDMENAARPHYRPSPHIFVRVHARAGRCCCRPGRLACRTVPHQGIISTVVAREIAPIPPSRCGGVTGGGTHFYVVLRCQNKVGASEEVVAIFHI